MTRGHALGWWVPARGYPHHPALARATTLPLLIQGGEILLVLMWTYVVVSNSIHQRAKGT